jgi:tetratricopeptide (TPR) repeat protein
MTRWLVAVVAAALVVAAGWLLLLNPEPAVLRLTPTRTIAPPLAAALLAAFLAGAILVVAVDAVRAGTRGWRRWRAERHARRAARRDHTVARARDLVWAGEYAQARAELLRGANGDPDVPRLVLLAETHLRENDPGAARRILEDGLVRVGLDPHLLDLLADAAERGGDLRGAADALERARRAQPDSPRLARRLRDVYAASGRWEEATAVQQELLLRLRDAATLAAEATHLRRLRYQAALGDPDPVAAARRLLALAREDPDFVPAWVSAGDRLLAAGRRVAARRAWRRGAAKRPAAVLLERLERVNAEDRHPERTTRAYRRLLRGHPEAPALALLFARHLLAHGSLEEASEVLSRLPAAVAGHPAAHALWGELHRRRGNHQLAADTFVRAWGPELAFGPFRCASCQRRAETWSGYCEDCGRWDTMRGAVEALADPASP